MPTRISRPVFVLIATVTLALGIPLGIVLASHQFTDVPTSHLFHADIDAIADAGVTTGCATNPSRYCPDRFVTRGEMAAFLNRLGALAPGSSPKVNASKVGGYAANELVRAAGASGSATPVAITSTEPTYQDTISFTIVAPKAGFVLVTASVTAQNTAISCAVFECGVFARLRHVQTNTLSPAVVVSVHGTVTPTQTASATQTFAVSAGTHTFTLQVARGNASQSPSYLSPQMTGLFVPFGSSGGATLGD
jgi:hypothetical protein